MVIRRANINDVDRITYLAEIMMSESNYSELVIDREKASDFIREIINTDKFLLVVEIDGVIVGGMIGDIITPWYSNDKIGIDYVIFILKEHRGNKGCFALVYNFIEWCKINGCKQLRPGISTGQESLGKVYENFGFKKSGNNYLMEL